MRNAVPLLAALVLAACASPLRSPAPVAAKSEELPPLLPPATLGAPAQAEQSLRIAYADQEISLRCVVLAEPARLLVIGLSPSGQRLLSASWDGQRWQVDAVQAVAGLVEPQRLGVDLQLALWPLPALQSAYAAAGWQLSEPYGGVRRLRRDGRLVAEVHYANADAGADPWQGRLWLVNFSHGYSLGIDTQRQ